MVELKGETLAKRRNVSYRSRQTLSKFRFLMALYIMLGTNIHHITYTYIYYSAHSPLGLFSGRLHQVLCLLLT